LAGEPSVVELAAAASVAVEATTTDVPGVLASAALSEGPVVGIVPVQVESTLVSVGVTRPVIEMGSGSAQTGLSLATDIMEELRQIMQQFFASMKSCIELVLSRGSSFEFAQMLLENQIENICHTGSPAQARAHLVLVEQLESCLRELKTLEKTSSMDEARSMLGKLLTAQEHE